MKLACCSWSYHRAMEAGRVSFKEWLRTCAEELGVGGVDLIAEQLPKRTKSFWLETKKRCTDFRLTVAALSPSTNFGKPTARQRQAELDRLHRWIEAAFTLGAPCVRIFAGWPPPGREAELWEPMVGCLRLAAKAASQAGVTLVVEPHNHGGFLADSHRTLQLMRDVDSPWVRINLDVGNYHQPDLYAGLEASLPLAPHVVAKIHHLSPAGEETTLDYGKIFAMLKRHRYHGFLTVEYEGKADERVAVPRAVAMLRRYALKYGL